MKKYLILILIIVFTGVTPLLANFYICRGSDCAMYVIEYENGFSWFIECMDGSSASGNTDGAAYGGNCQQVEL